MYIYTLEHDGKILGLGGYGMVTSTTCWGWVNLSHHAGSNVRAVFRTIKEWTSTFCADHGISRVQAFVRPDFPEAIRLVEHLGFTLESTMENFYGDGNDGLLYKRIICSTK